MISKLNWLIAPLAVAALVACGAEEGENVEELENTNEDFVESLDEISIGFGSGASFQEGLANSSVGSNDLEAGGTTTLTVNVVNLSDSSTLYSGPTINVTFDSGCFRSQTATFSQASVSTSGGVVTTEYTAEGCIGEDTIIAKLDLPEEVELEVDVEIASTKVNVLVAEAEKLSFVTEEFSPVIAIGDTSLDGAPSSTNITFSVVDENGFPLPGKEVLFSLSSGSDGYATLGEQTTKTSDINGIVSTVVNAGRGGKEVRVYASHTLSDTTIITSQSPVISVMAGELEIGSGSEGTFSQGVITASTGVSSNLAAYGTSTLSFNIVESSNANVLYLGKNTEVELSSACLTAGRSTVPDTTPVTSNGVFSIDYTAAGCVGEDTITAIYGETSAEVVITIDPSDVESIGFNSLTEASIAYTNASSGSQPSQSTVSFILYDINGVPVEGQDVTFAITSTDSNSGVNLSTLTATSDIDGIVSTIVNAGTAAASVRVLATFTPDSGNDISTQSPPISINTGPADSQSFSLSLSEASVKNAYNADGVTTTMSVQVADRQNNPVADGTIVSFWAEYGHIQPTCITSNGSCSSTWTSGGVRPDDGLATILAYTTGEDSFIDSGARNGIYNIAGDSALITSDETIISAPEMHYDLNYDGYTSTDFVDAGTGVNVIGDAFVDYNNNGSHDASSTKFRGSLCSDAAAAAGHCAEKSIQVWDQSQLALNTRTPKAVVAAGPWTAGSSYVVTVTDSLDNFPPAGTTLKVEALGSADADIDVTGEVPSVGESGKSGFNFVIYVNEVTTAGTHKITVDLGSGVTVIYTVSIN